MPSVSRSQQSASALALSAKRGKISPNKLYGAAKQMYNSMSEEQLRHYAETKTKNLPEKVAEERKFMKCPEIIKEAIFGIGKNISKGWIKTKHKGISYMFNNTAETHKIMQRRDINSDERIKLMLKNKLMKKV